MMKEKMCLTWYFNAVNNFLQSLTLSSIWVYAAIVFTTAKCVLMKRLLQFLAIEDIPVLLFDFLPTTRNQKYQELNTENFIQAVQKFSFGVLHGEDEDRFINTYFIKRLGVICDDLIQLLAPYNAMGR
jgi:hypothetical protein